MVPGRSAIAKPAERPNLLHLPSIRLSKRNFELSSVSKATFLMPGMALYQCCFLHFLYYNDCSHGGFPSPSESHIQVWPDCLLYFGLLSLRYLDTAPPASHKYIDWVPVWSIHHSRTGWAR